MSAHTTRLPLVSRHANADEIHRATKGLPGRQRNLATLRAVRRERAERQEMPEATTLQQRHHHRILARFAPEIRRRGGETTIEGKHSTETLAVTDSRDGMALLHAEGWRHYGSRTPARWARLSYLCGVDDAGPWAVRVTGTLTKVGQALAEITPTEVKDARRRGLRVARQGDVWAIEVTQGRADTGTDMVVADSHHWRASTGFLVHRPEDGRRHRPVRISWPARFVVAHGRGMGRHGQYRTNAD